MITLTDIQIKQLPMFLDYLVSSRYVYERIICPIRGTNKILFQGMNSFLGNSTDIQIT
jgi:hypothetical protein